MAAARALRRWGPVVVWMAAIFYVSSLPRLGAAGRIPDWITHGIAYAVGGFLFAHALSADTAPAVGALAAATVLATLYGVTDEVHQSFVPGRDADVMDVVKDFAGALAGAAVYGRWGTMVTRAVLPR